MTPFFALSELARAFFALWALLLCLAEIGGALLAAVKKRFRSVLPPLLLLAPTYLIWQVIFDIRLFGVSDGANGISRALGGISWLWWLAAFAALTAASALVLYGDIRYGKNNITPGAIKVFLDNLPCGICCWRENGRVLFSNVCMDRLSREITGSPPLNGNQLYGAVKGGMISVGDRMWRFSCREMNFGGDILRELIASDITAEYAETRALERDKAELSRLNRELREYTIGIDETVRRREILQAKVNIHDEMNRLMLSTAAAKSGDAGEMDRIFSLWERNALLLCMEAGDRDGAGFAGLEKLAKTLKIKIIRGSPLPGSLSAKQRSLYFIAANEAVTNAVKHAGAKEITLSFAENGSRVICGFTNSLERPAAEVRFAGGLANLARLAEKQGAGVAASAGENFTLTLSLPKNQPDG